jgi:uncharacterized membrane protein YoaK (UPF0700 family)
MIAVSAMACQFALLRLGIPDAPSAAVMTGNLTNTTLSIVFDVFARRREAGPSPKRLSKSLPPLVGFLVGCVLGAAAVSAVGDWAWSFPVVLAGVAAVLA